MAKKPQKVADAAPAAQANPEAPVAPEAAQNPPAAAPEQKPAEKPAKKALPKSVTLARPYGFIDDSGAMRYWNPGVVSEPADIATLIERKAPVEIPE